MHVQAFYLLLLCLSIRFWVILSQSNDDGTNLPEVSLNDNGKNKTSFYENGFPPITTDIAKLLFSDNPEISTTMLVPNETVIVNNLKQEENLFISFENVEYIKNINFHLYENLHPGGPNFKMNITSKVIERCNSARECESMAHCQVGNLNADGDEISKTTVFLSWKIHKKHLIIVFQYKNLIIKCQDFNSFSLNKVVTEVTISENIKILHRRDILYVSENNNTEPYPIRPNNSVYICVSLCLTCTLQITLHCGENDTQTARSNTCVIYDNNVIARGWEKIVFHNETFDGNQNCNLTFKPQYDGKDIEGEKFWAIAPIMSGSINNTNSRWSCSFCKQSKETTSKELDQNKNVIKNDNQHKSDYKTVIGIGIGAGVGVATIIIAIAYVCSKKSRTTHNPRSDETELDDLHPKS